MDLTDDTERAALRNRLERLYAGRPVLFGPGVLAAYTPLVRRQRELGGSALVVYSIEGVGELPGEDECVRVRVPAREAWSVTEELRDHERSLRRLPPEAVAAIECFDPDRRGVWVTTPFVRSDEPVLGRPVTGGRPASFLALEDKLLAEQVWAAAGVPAAPSRVVPVDHDMLVAASREVGSALGAVWSGDAREGLNGGGDYVRWVRTPADAAAAVRFFAAHCDRVRVLPFLDGVPCSIHGCVLADGTAAFRPCEIGMLRSREQRRFVYGGLSSFWDPPAADREAMRQAARRVGEHLRAAYGYRGVFGIDGVLTADGFLPTELNPRLSVGLRVVADFDAELFSLLQAHLVAGIDPGVGVADLEALLPLMDAHRCGRPAAAVAGAKVGATDSYPVAYDGRTLSRADQATGSVLQVTDTVSGFFARVEPCALLRPGDRLGPVNAALLDLLDRRYGAGLGPVTAAPDLR